MQKQRYGIKTKRWINKGSKGIALITEKEGELGLRFVLMYQTQIVMFTAENSNYGKQKKNTQMIL